MSQKTQTTKQEACNLLHEEFDFLFLNNRNFFKIISKNKEHKFEAGRAAAWRESAGAWRLPKECRKIPKQLVRVGTTALRGASRSGHTAMLRGRQATPGGGNKKATDVTL
jgi:hypothetical protein